MNNDLEEDKELELMIKLIHPDPQKNLMGYLDSLPDELIELTVFRDASSNTTTEGGREIMMRTFKYCQEYAIDYQSGLMVLDRLLRIYYLERGYPGLTIEHTDDNE